MSFDLKKFQALAAKQISSRYEKFANHDERPGTRKRSKPYYQSLSAITGSGKTPILAQSVAEIKLTLDVNPIILWMSKAKSVVSQTYLNFATSGKYATIIDGFKVINIKDLTYSDINNLANPLMIVLTTGIFNNKDKAEGALNLFQEKPDLFGNTSPWEALKKRSVEGIRRPLIIVYDEAHNLSDQQTILLEELEPEAYLLASATLKYPAEFNRNVIMPYRSWTIDHTEDKDWYALTTIVDSKEVVEEGLIKRHIHFDGTTANMEDCIDDLLGQLKYLSSEAKPYGIKPKSIYVCNTNINDEGDKDDPKLPFDKRKSPPIRIWNYLVSKGINPNDIAVYTSELAVDLSTAPKSFHLYGKKEDDFYKFQEGNFHHIIFNQSLQEGWDDPECYLAYIDKSMESKIQVEQIIGRVLRQPNITHYENPALNTAHLYIRVDKKESFGKTVDSVKQKLSNQLPTNSISATFLDGIFEAPIEIHAKTVIPSLGKVNIDSGEAEEQINVLIQKLTKIEEGEATTIGESEISSKELDLLSGKLAEVNKWEVAKKQTRKVRLRWLISTRVRERSHRVQMITLTSDSSFDIPVQFGSMVDEQIISIVNRAVDIYKNESKLDYHSLDEFEFPKLRIRPSTAITYENGIYEQYSGLNNLEKDFAKALDETGYPWHRNSSSAGGYAIPLLDDGVTANFYPDFLVWKDDLIISLDTKGRHILDEAIKRKLFDIKEGLTTKIITRFITVGKQVKTTDTPSKDGYTVWKFKNSQEVPVPCDTIDEAVKVSITL